MCKLWITIADTPLTQFRYLPLPPSIPTSLPPSLSALSSPYLPTFHLSPSLPLCHLPPSLSVIHLPPSLSVISLPPSLSFIYLPPSLSFSSLPPSLSSLCHLPPSLSVISFYIHHHFSLLIISCSLLYLCGHFFFHSRARYNECNRILQGR